MVSFASRSFIRRNTTILESRKDKPRTLKGSEERKIRNDVKSRQEVARKAGGENDG